MFPYGHQPEYAYFLDENDYGTIKPQKSLTKDEVLKQPKTNIDLCKAILLSKDDISVSIYDIDLQWVALPNVRLEWKCVEFYHFNNLSFRQISNLAKWLFDYSAPISVYVGGFLYEGEPEDMEHISSIYDILKNNYSLENMEFEFDDSNINEMVKKEVASLTERNRKGYEKCKTAAREGFLTLKKPLGKDLSRSIAQMIWETRGTKIWCDC